MRNPNNDAALKTGTQGQRRQGLCRQLERDVTQSLGCYTDPPRADTRGLNAMRASGECARATNDQTDLLRKKKQTQPPFSKYPLRTALELFCSQSRRFLRSNRHAIPFQRRTRSPFARALSPVRRTSFAGFHSLVSPCLSPSASSLAYFFLRTCYWKEAEGM